MKILSWVVVGVLVWVGIVIVKDYRRNKAFEECNRRAAFAGQQRLDFQSDRDNFQKVKIDLARCSILYE